MVPKRSTRGYKAKFHVQLARLDGTRKIHLCHAKVELHLFPTVRSLGKVILLLLYLSLTTPAYSTTSVEAENLEHLVVGPCRRS